MRLTSRPGRGWKRAVVAWCSALAGLGAAQESDYVIGPQDTVIVTVWNQADLAGEYTVEADGSFAFPLIGRVDAGGLTIRGLERELHRLLADGFFRRPQVSVSMKEYRSQRVFVMGEVREPGPYPLTRSTTLLEALASAGSTTDRAADHVVIVPAESRADPNDDTAWRPDPVQGGAKVRTRRGTTRVTTVDLETLQRGGAAPNVVLRAGDTIFVPLAEMFYVIGEVKAPGEYPIRRPTTVRQALALAGGITEFGATNRVTVIRRVGRREREVRVSLGDAVEAGDTVVVPARYF